MAQRGRQTCQPASIAACVVVVQSTSGFTKDVSGPAACPQGSSGAASLEELAKVRAVFRVEFLSSHPGLLTRRGQLGYNLH